MNLGLLLDMAADGSGDRVAVGTLSGGWAASDLRARARCAARSFLAADVEHIGFFDLNSKAVPLALFGAALAGLPFAPVNYRLNDDQLAAILRRLAPGLVIVGADVEARLSVIGPIDGVEFVSTDDFVAAADADADHEDADSLDELPSIDPEQIAVVLFTSGTTGDPKAAVLCHHHLTSYVLETIEFMGADPSDAQLVSVPCYHIAGMSAVLSCLFSGRRIVYLEAFDAESWLEGVEAERITQAMVVPTMLDRVLRLAEARGSALATLRHLSYGGGRMPLELIERALTQLPLVNFVNAYGLTETSSTVAILAPDDHREAVGSSDSAIRARLTSVGRPLPTIEMEIRDPDGCPVGPGVRGEIHVRGEQVAREYLDGSVLTEGGWFPTKDAGYVDAAGFLYLDGRLDDVIVRGGENLSPGQIEDVLMQHPSVADAGVVGVPSAEWGEAVVAAVVLEPGVELAAAELQSWVRSRLRSTRTPELIEFRAELPYNETGKLLRRILRTELSVLSATGSEPPKRELSH